MAWMKFSSNWGLENFQASWIRPALPAAVFYSVGFSNEVAIAGSRFIPPRAFQRTLNITAGKIIFSGGNLPDSVTNLVWLTKNNLILNQSPNLLTMTINTNVGTFTGTFRAPGRLKVYTYRGAILQNSNAGWGYFMGTNQSGQIYFGPR